MYYASYAHTISPTAPAINSDISSLSYDMCQLGNLDLWDGCTSPISMFGQIVLQEINVNNIKIPLHHIFDFVSNRDIKNNREEDIPFLKGFG